MKKKEDVFIYWLAVVLSIIGIIAIVVLALHAVGLV